MEIGLAARRPDLDFEALRVLGRTHDGLAIAIVSQKVPGRDHQLLVRVAANDVQPAHAWSAAQPHEQAVAAQEETPAQGLGHEGWAKPVRLDEGDGGQPMVSVTVEDQGGGQKRLEQAAGKGIGQHETVAEVRDHRKRVPLQVSAEHYTASSTRMVPQISERSRVAHSLSEGEAGSRRLRR